MLHALVTFAASVVRIVSPGANPRTVGIVLEPRASQLSCFLAGAELGIACFRPVRDGRTT